MLYEILKTSKLGASFAPDMYTALWAQKLARDGEVKTLSGAPPLSFQANGTPLLDYLISGNTVQSGTSTHDSPVMPQGTGERTGNLFSCNIEQGTISAEGTLRSAGNRVRSDDFIIMEMGEYTINALSESGVSKLFVFEYMEDGTFVSRTPADLANVPYTFSLTGKRKIKFVFASIYDKNINPTMVNSVMLNSGSTPLPYEPYGIKIPISSAGQTTPVYLGEVETTRKIKKLVLTGEENWIKSSAYQGSFYVPKIGDVISETYTAYCSHLVFSALSQYAKGKFCFNGGIVKNCNLWFNQFDSNTTVEELKSYLAAQYAAGTPVTVWYVLATETTGIVNEPLMKIGEYADSISKAQAGVEIPTVNGSNTLDVLTDVKPSEIYIKYKS